MKHTALPWRVFDEGDRFPGIESDDDNFSIVVFGDEEESDLGIQGVTHGVALANARLIVNAVNNFEPLKTALRELRDECDAMQGPELRDDPVWGPLLRAADIALANADGTES